MTNGKPQRLQIIVLAGLMLGTGALCGCDTQAARMERLKKAADRIATAETAKFNALEAPYKEEVVFFSKGEILPEMDYGDGTFCKRYRNFTGHTLKNIFTTDSLIYPYILEIEYPYQLLMTEGRGAISKDDQKAREQSQQDTVYQAANYQITRRYYCDAEGKHVGKMSDLPPLDSFYRRGRHPVEESQLTNTP